MIAVDVVVVAMRSVDTQIKVKLLGML